MKIIGISFFIWLSVTRLAFSYPETMTPEKEKIFAYIVAEHYLDYGEPESSGTSFPIGNDLFKVLILDQGTTVRNVKTDDLEFLNISSTEAWRIADENQASLLKNQIVKSRVFPNGPEGKTFVLFGGHWGARSSITWSGLHEKLTGVLGSERLIISIPHRGAMIVFPEGSENYIKQMKDIIKERESDEKKPLSFDLFLLTSTELSPYEK